MSDQFTPRYLLIVSANPATPQRLATMVPALQSTLARLADGPIEPAFRSLGADHFGYFLASRRTPRQINDVLRSPSQGYAWFGDEGWAEPFLTNADHLMIVEVGEGFTGSSGFGRAMSWLLRR